MSELTQFDRWEIDPGCEHHGFLVERRIGNMSFVADIREWVDVEQRLTEHQFPIVLKKVVYSGIHGGDCLKREDVQSLVGELKVLENLVKMEHHQKFVTDMKDLCEASLASGNPIAF